MRYMLSLYLLFISGNTEKKEIFNKQRNTFSNSVDKRSVNKMSKKLTASSAKASLASNRNASNDVKNKDILKPMAISAHLTKKANPFEINNKNNIEISKLQLSSTSSGNNSTNGGDMRQKSKLIKNKDNQQILQEIESLYDDYLISELMKINAESNCNITCNQINDEVVDMWSSIEMLRSEVLKIQESNELDKSMLNFYNAADSENPTVETIINNTLPETSRIIKDLTDAVEQSKHHLKVLGTTIDPNEDTETPLLKVLIGVLTQLSSLFNKKQDNSYNKTAAQMSQLNIDFEKSVLAFDNCKELLNRLRTTTLHSTSVMLSKRAHEENINNGETESQSIELFNFDKCTMEEIISASNASK